MGRARKGQRSAATSGPRSHLLQQEYGTTKSESLGLSMKLVDPGTLRAAALKQTDAALGTVLENRLLTAPGIPAKRHIEFELPEGMIYHAGDYLAVLPTNPDASVRRVLAHFNISREQEVKTYAPHLP
jgi:cytochrome P450/NADPH-cytochrome P450 reductase